MTGFALLLLLAMLGVGWRYRRQPAGAVALVAVVALAMALSVARACRAVRSETPVVPRNVHFAVGFRLGELAAERVPEHGLRVLVVCPKTSHPAHRRVVETQMEGLRHALRNRRPRLEIEELDLHGESAQIALPLSVPRIRPDRLRQWARQYPGLQAIVSLAGAPRIEEGDGPSDTPPLVALSFTEPSELRLAFEQGWLAACVFQRDSGRDLDLRKLSERDIVERTCDLVTDADARAGRIPWTF